MNITNKDVRRIVKSLSRREMGRMLFDRLMEVDPAQAVRMLRSCGARVSNSLPSA